MDSLSVYTFISPEAPRVSNDSGLEALGYWSYKHYWGSMFQGYHGLEDRAILFIFLFLLKPFEFQMFLD